MSLADKPFPYFSEQEKQQLENKGWEYDAMMYSWRLPRLLPLNGAIMSFHYSSYPEPCFRSYITYKDKTRELMTTNNDSAISAARDTIDAFIQVFSEKAPDYLRTPEFIKAMSDELEKSKP